MYIAYNNYNVIMCNMGYPVRPPSVGYEKAMKTYHYTKSAREANAWWKSAMDAGYKRGAEVGTTEGEKTLHMNSFMCGVEWVLKHRPIPRAYRNIKKENNND